MIHVTNVRKNCEMTSEEVDIMYMQRCIQLARCGVESTAPNPMVGAVIVCDGRIIGEGYHRKCGGPHAEVNAIASVKDPSLLAKSTLYVSLEPCAHYGKTPPCADLIVEKRIPKVVIGCGDPFARVNGLGIKKLVDAGIEVKVGVLEEECIQLNKRFMTYHKFHRPWVTLKWAQSADGFVDRIRRNDEDAARISSHYTMTLVHRLRALNGAILVGTETVLQDNPSLTNRLWPGNTPLRLSIDRHGRLSDVQHLHLMDESTPTHIFPNGDLLFVLSDLYQRGIQSLLVEGGTRLLSSFIEEGLWDEARVEEASLVLGEGVRAPKLTQATLVDRALIDGHWISVYSHS